MSFETWILEREREPPKFETWENTKTLYHYIKKEDKLGNFLLK
jgi:hypothetical protein